MSMSFVFMVVKVQIVVWGLFKVIVTFDICVVS
jgi:hypothetical protein